MKKIMLSLLLASSFSACTYTASDIHVVATARFTEAGVPYSSKKVRLCARVSYIDANLTDIGHQFTYADICRTVRTNSEGVAHVFFDGEVSDFAYRSSARFNNSPTADISDVKFFVKLGEQVELPTSMNLSGLGLNDHYVSGSISLNFNF